MNIADARDVLLGIFKGAWDTTGFPATYPDVPGEPSKTEDKVDTPWARAMVQHVVGRQASLAGETGARRWNASGFVTIQIFAPVGDGMNKADELAQTVVNAYRDAKVSPVWIRNPRFREVGTSGGFTQVNVLADFQYDDVR